jgi:hypothetical protein
VVCCTGAAARTSRWRWRSGAAAQHGAQVPLLRRTTRGGSWRRTALQRLGAALQQCDAPQAARRLRRAAVAAARHAPQRRRRHLRRERMCHGAPASRVRSTTRRRRCSRTRCTSARTHTRTLRWRQRGARRRSGVHKRPIQVKLKLLI